MSSPKIISQLRALLKLLDESQQVDEASASGMEVEDLADVGTTLDRIQKEAATRLEHVKALLRVHAEDTRPPKDPSVTFAGRLGKVMVVFKTGGLEAKDDVLIRGKAVLSPDTYREFFVEKVTVKPVDDFGVKVAALPEGRERDYLSQSVVVKAPPAPSVTFPK